MNQIRALLQTAWRWMPQGLRRATSAAPGVARLRDQVARWGLSHDEIYDARYYDEVDDYARRSLDIVAASIIEVFHPQRVIDVGCGTGALLQYLKERGVDGLGLERSEAGLERCRQRGLNVVQFDLLKDSLPGKEHFDLAVSMEVAEHLPSKGADRYVEFLCGLAPVVVFTAAPPGQLGVDHINLQPREYWIDKFARHGFAQDNRLIKRWSDTWKAAGVADFYGSNLIVFLSGDWRGRA